MNLKELNRIWHSFARRLKEPKQNAMPISMMAYLYLRRKIYLRFYQIPALQIPLSFDQKDSEHFAARIVVVVHCFYPDLMDELLSYTQNIPFPFKLCVSTDTDQKRSDILDLIRSYKIPNAEVRMTPNRGRDIAPKYITFRDVYCNHDYFLFLHSKKSPHTGSWGHEWRQYLLKSLTGSQAIVRSNLRILSDPRIGLVFPTPLNETLPSLRWGNNFKASFDLGEKMNIKVNPSFCRDYPDGSMFWGRVAAIRPLLDLKLSFEHFSIERGQLDGDTSHALERLVAYSALSEGLKGCRVGVGLPNRFLRKVNNDLELSDAIASCLDAQEKERREFESFL